MDNKTVEPKRRSIMANGPEPGTAEYAIEELAREAEKRKITDFSAKELLEFAYNQKSGPSWTTSYAYYAYCLTTDLCTYEKKGVVKREKINVCDNWTSIIDFKVNTNPFKSFRTPPQFTSTEEKAEKLLIDAIEESRKLPGFDNNFIPLAKNDKGNIFLEAIHKNTGAVFKIWESESHTARKTSIIDTFSGIHWSKRKPDLIVFAQRSIVTLVKRTPSS